MPIAPDNKNWFVVLDEPCTECGYDAESIEIASVGATIRQISTMWPALLDRPDVTTRPNDSQWSALEYSAHMRDVFRLFDVRLAVMLGPAGGTFPSFDPQATADAADYNNESVAQVLASLQASAESLAAKLDSITDAALARSAHREDGVEFFVASWAKYVVHDPMHHVVDIQRGNQILDG
jgi:DinB superfamily